MSAASVVIAHPIVDVIDPFASTTPGGISPSQMQSAYGFNRLPTGGNNGTGQTIAIVDAYHDPTALSDLQAFDRAFGLSDPPSLTVVSQTGHTTDLPSLDPGGNWRLEESLDIQWAHALAPGASIVLVEARSASYTDLTAAIKTAANWANVSVVSMSWGSGEYMTETLMDSIYMTPIGHRGVTFVASTGDSGAPGGYPAYSPNVVAVGGTTLKIDASGGYTSESAWSRGGGGISSYESQPAYQHGVVTQSSTKRSIPDVAFDADPQSGVPVYDSYTNGADHPWSRVGGTSLSAPAFAAMISIVDQGRAANGLGSLDGASQTLPMLYQLHQTNPSAFHDVTTGSNGFAAGPGYDLATGLGSPIANLLVPAMTGTPSTTSKLVFQQSPTTGTAGLALGTMTIAIEKPNGQVITSDNSIVTLSVGSGPTGFASGSTISVAAVNGIATFHNLILNAAGTYTLSAKESGLTSGTSQNLSIGAASAAKVVFQQQPTTGTVGHALSPDVRAAIEDRFGNIVTNNSSTVTASIASGPAGFTAGSTASIAAVNGIATFSNLVFGTAGSYTLGIRDASLTGATSASFTVSGKLAAPQNVAVVALTSTTARLSWSAVSGAQGYRIFLVNGSQSVLIATETSATTSATLAGLIAGTRYSYKVQAYSGSLIGDSQIVSITMPSNLLSTPVLTIDVLGSTYVRLNWTPVPGAQGYRIYEANGTSRVCISTAIQGVTSMRVFLLTSGVTYKFQVEAFQNAIVQDSAWVSVTPSAAQAQSNSVTSASVPDNAELLGTIRRSSRG